MRSMSRRAAIAGIAAGLAPLRPALAARPRTAELTALSASLDAEAVALAEAPEAALGRIQTLLRQAAIGGAFDPWRSLPSGTEKVDVLGSGALNRTWKVQLFRIPEGRSHPPHCHENLASCLLVLDGRLRMREYERLRDRETEDAALLRRVFDGELAPGEGILTAEDRRNAHWFGAVGGGPALAVNFKASGYFRRELFRLRNRRYLDASSGAAGEFRAPFISSAEAKARFAHQPP